MSTDGQTLALLRRHARELQDLEDVGPLLDAVADAPVVLLGEATHGTHEFYRLRSALTRRLMAERGFDAVAVEADWPDALRVSRYIRGDARVANLDAALGGFERFARWMWRNAETGGFVQGLRQLNAQRPPEACAGFYGLDLYSLRGSMDSVIRYLQQAAPDLAREARERYACFDHLASDPQRYAFATLAGEAPGCEQQVVQQLAELMGRAGESLREETGADELFYAQQNARVVRNAEAYYRAMVRGGEDSWNLRDTHMADTLDALREHIAAQRGRPAKVVVWAHNSHIGDARATEPGERGQLTLGQLVRQRCEARGERCRLLGFTTHEGHVAAADDWDGPVQHKAINPSRPGSIERLLHDAGLRRALLPLADAALRRALSGPRLERAIGVVYRPQTERWSHYFHADIAAQFDAVVHVDRTSSVIPLDPPVDWPVRAEQDMWPSGL